MITVIGYRSPLGPLTLAAEEGALVGLWFDGQRSFGSTLPERYIRAFGTLPSVLSQAREWLDRYFSGRDPGAPPPLRTASTAFRNAVWKLLLTIPYGQTVTYGELAARLAKDLQLAKVSARAVGGAVGQNPLLLMIPCHRVTGAGGALTGYSGGIERKRALLSLEAGAP